MNDPLHDAAPAPSGLAEPRPRPDGPGIPRTALPDEVLRAALGALDRGMRAVIATVVARHGSAPSTPGQKLALLGPSDAVGTIGGGAIERVVLEAMGDLLTGPPAPPRMETFRLGPTMGMCCGGSVDVLIESVEPAVHALVIGAGHVGTFVAPLLASLGFQVTLGDARAEAADATRLPASALSPAPGPEARPDDAPAIDPAARGRVRMVHAEHDDPEILQEFARDLGRAVFLVMTHDHQLDQTAIEWAIRKGFGFVGGVGSRAKAARTRSRLEAKGFPPEDIARIRMPVGLDIGARSPAEIGVSIAGELVRWRASLFVSPRAGQEVKPGA